MCRSIAWAAVLALTGTLARADQYWIEYEPANGRFPEQESWQRVTSHGGAQRYFDDGWLVMDGLASPNIVDGYIMSMHGELDPGPGEQFVMQWRIRIDEVQGYYDPGAGVFSDEKWGVGFKLNQTTIYSEFEGVSASFQAGVAHTFDFRSEDMRTYVLSIDEVPAIYGHFWLSLTASRAHWGDVINGGASLARWDYFRFGVVPEPHSLLLLFISLSRWRVCP